jgi:hypothetical protein
MNTLAAMEETVALAYARGMATDMSGKSSTDFSHIDHMLNKMRTESMSEGKINRWLGWAQACVVVSNIATLDEVKEINKRHS